MTIGLILFLMFFCRNTSSFGELLQAIMFAVIVVTIFVPIFPISIFNASL